MDSQPTATKLVIAASNNVLCDHVFGSVLGLLFLWCLPGWLRCCFMFLIALFLLSHVFGTFITDFKPREKVYSAGKAVVITGCDSGFGHMLAEKLDDLGYQVFAGCLFPEGEGAEKLRKSTSDRLHVVGLDVTKDEDVQRTLAYVKENLGKNQVWAVVCNAGVNDGAEIMWTDMSIIQKVIDVNFFGVVRVTKAFLPLLCQSKGSRVVAVASAAGRYSFPGMSPYCVSKHCIVSFSDSLRMEMCKFGVQVVTIEPWMYRTALTDEQSVAAYVLRTWDKAPEEIKSLYPSGYVETMMKYLHWVLNFSSSHVLSEVVSCLEESVTAVHPKFSYSPGTVSSRVVFWFLRKLPKPTFDLLFLASSVKLRPLTQVHS